MILLIHCQSITLLHICAGVRWLRVRSLGPHHLWVALSSIIPRTKLLFTEGARGEEGGRLLELLWLLYRREAT